MAVDINKDNLLENISNILSDYSKSIKQAIDIPSLNQLEINSLGRKSELTTILKKINEKNDENQIQNTQSDEQTL